MFFNLLVYSIDIHVHFWLLLSKRAHLKGFPKKSTTAKKVLGQTTQKRKKGKQKVLNPQFKSFNSTLSDNVNKERFFRTSYQYASSSMEKNNKSKYGKTVNRSI